MRKHLISLPDFGLAASLGACGSSPATGTPEVAMTRHESEISQNEAPDWFINPPKEAGYVYSAGSAVSSDLPFALDKAILNAKYLLADRIDGGVTGTAHGSNRAARNFVAALVMPGYQVVQRKVVPQDTLYRSYVLLKFPIVRIAPIAPEQTAGSPQPAAQLQQQAKAAFDGRESEVVPAPTSRKITAFPNGTSPPAAGGRFPPEPPPPGSRPTAGGDNTGFSAMMPRAFFLSLARLCIIASAGPAPALAAMQSQRLAQVADIDGLRKQVAAQQIAIASPQQQRISGPAAPPAPQQVAAAPPTSPRAWVADVYRPVQYRLGR